MLGIPLAPITCLVGWFTADTVWEQLKRHVPSQVGLAALGAAEIERGRGAGEFGGNNRGPDVERYRGGNGGSGSWCAAFVFYCLRRGFTACGKRPTIERTHGARKLFRRVVAAGWLVRLEDLQPGDIVLWARGPQGSWKAHIGIVSRVVRDRSGKVTSWWYVAGNEGPYPARVQKHKGTRRRRIGFARVG